MKLKDLKLSKIVELLPMMSEEEYGMLKADIKEYGIKEPLVIIGNEVIDGRHRYLAAKELKIKDVPVKEIEEPEEGLETYVLSLNLSRRHLNPGQKVIVLLDAKSVASDRSLTIPKIASMSAVGETTVKSIQYIIKNGAKEEVELVRSGESTAKTVQGIIKKRLQPAVEKIDSTSKLDTTILNAHVSTSSGNNITTTKVDPVDQEKIVYVKKHGNDVQRMVVDKNPSAVDKIYTIITKKIQDSLPPTPMPVEVPPTNNNITTTTTTITIDWEAKYNQVYKEKDEVIEICLRLEAENVKLKAEVDILSKIDANSQPEEEIDYTKRHGRECTQVEIDKLDFTDHPTYVRLTSERQKHLIQEYENGFK